MKRVVFHLVIEELLLLLLITLIAHDPEEARSISTDMTVMATLGAAMAGAKLLIYWWDRTAAQEKTVNPLINAGMTAVIAVVFLLAYLLIYHLEGNGITASVTAFSALGTTLIYIAGDKFFTYICNEEYDGRQLLKEMKKLIQPSRNTLDHQP